MDKYPAAFSVDRDSIQASIQMLAQHTDAANNNIRFLKAAYAHYTGDYSRCSLKRSALKKCHCENVNFNSATFTGSQFQGVVFEGCDFSNAAADFSLFYDCKFLSGKNTTLLLNSNFSNASIINSSLSGLSIHKSVVSNALFKDTSFSACSIQYSSFENVSFYGCRFSNMELRNLNLDFAEFSHTAFENVILPFSQIPYTFGLLQSLKSAGNSLWVSSKQSKGKISIRQYFELFPALIQYYISRQEYFPLANIYIAQNNYDMAFQAIMCGIQKAGYEKDFRMLKYFCKLARLSGWCSREALNSLYDYIYDYRHFEPMEPFERRNYYLNLGEIRDILIVDNPDMPALYFRFQSNILPDDKENLTSLLNTIDQTIGEIPGHPISHKIELRHESPYDILVVAVGTIVALAYLADLFNILCKPVGALMDLKIKQQTIRLNDQKLKLGEQDILISEAKLQELEESAQRRRAQLSKSGILLDGSGYFINDDRTVQ